MEENKPITQDVLDKAIEDAKAFSFALSVGVVKPQMLMNIIGLVWLLLLTFYK